MGIVRGEVIVPSPSCPFPLVPQQYASPFGARAQVLGGSVVGRMDGGWAGGAVVGWRTTAGASGCAAAVAWPQPLPV
jgi:hypothetical protein